MNPPYSQLFLNLFLHRQISVIWYIFSVQVERQKRFTFEERHFYIDLVLYNSLLQAYCLLNLKMDDLTHQDLGQMQMYVNYYDRYVKEDFEKLTIGILLCERKNDALVELTLPKDC